MFALPPVALIRENAQAEGLLRSDIGPVHAELADIEFQIHQPVQQPARRRVGTGIVQVVERASGAALDAPALAAAVGTGRNAVGVFDLVHMAAGDAGYVVRIRTPMRSVLPAIAQVFGSNGAMDQQPERDGSRPLARR